LSLPGDFAPGRHKLARIAWALLSGGEATIISRCRFQPPDAAVEKTLRLESTTPLSTFPPPHQANESSTTVFRRLVAAASI